MSFNPTITNTNGDAPLTVGFYLDPNDPNLTVEWQQYDDKAGVAEGFLANFTYFLQGSFVTQLRVKDGSGAVVYQTNITIQVGPKDNQINFSQQYAIGYAGKIDPGVSVSPSGFSPLGINWYFGDGTSDYITRDPRDTNPMYTYKNPGTYCGYVKIDTGDGVTMIQRDFQVIVL